MRTSRTQSQTLFLVSALCAAVAACGGGDDDTPVTTPTPVTATFAGCFELTPGVSYTQTDPDDNVSDRVLVVKETFEGVERTGVLDFSDLTDHRRSVSYWSQESNGIRFWGSQAFNLDGSVFYKSVSSDGAVLPLTLQAGQAVTLDYTDTVTSGGQTTTKAEHEKWTFVGFESLTLGGKVFADACKVTIVDPTDPEDRPSTAWFAKGFGVIRVTYTNHAGAPVEVVLDSVVKAQP
ncbi:hypothetical protein [Methylibium rhizosphaerae]|uniref:hypothetical protein n=1 Tax=Methylibium rhizosphaerae TaxID=2570323 RepID=UPI00112DCA96|nr:hypothetical protein [Methylibium rhizosphaerae]